MFDIYKKYKMYMEKKVDIKDSKNVHHLFQNAKRVYTNVFDVYEKG